jgi:hypothetical protein
MTIEIAHPPTTVVLLSLHVGRCRRVEQKEWLVANISMSDPVPQDLTERSSKCSNDVHLSATKTWPASRDQA